VRGGRLRALRRFGVDQCRHDTLEAGHGSTVQLRVRAGLDQPNGHCFEQGHDVVAIARVEFASGDAEVDHLTKQVAALGGGSDEFGSFLTELASSVAVAVEKTEDPWRKAIRETIESADRQGFLVHRLQAHMGEKEPKGWEGIVKAFKGDLQRLREIDNELERLGNPWPEAAQGVLMDPDRLDEAEALLASVRERQRGFPKLGDGPLLHDLSGFEPMALRAAAQLVGDERPDYNPLFVWSSDEALGRTLLAAVGRTYKETFPDQQVAVASVAHFAEDFIRALAEGVAGAWRERWWTVDLLLVHGIQDLSDTERAQDEFFHLFEALKRRGARMMLVGNRSPSSVEAIDDRLRSRFEGGLVLQLAAGDAAELELVEQATAQAEDGIFVPDMESKTAKGPETRTMEPAALPEPPSKGGAWFPGPENVVIHWPRIEEVLIEELD